KVSKGSPVLELEVTSAEEPAASAESKPAAPASGAPAELAAAPEKKQETAPAAAAHSRSDGKVYAGPAVRKLARELGVDLSMIQGSSSKGRVQKEDLHNFVKARMQGPATASAAGGAGIPAVPDVDFSQFGEIETVPMSKLHKV